MIGLHFSTPEHIQRHIEDLSQEQRTELLSHATDALEDALSSGRKPTAEERQKAEKSIEYLVRIEC